MSSIFTLELQYINTTISQAEIVRQTGIPASTLSYVIRELRELPEIYAGAVSSYYSTIVAHNLVGMGLSEQQANRFTTNTPDQVLTIESYVADIANALTEGAIVRGYTRDEEGLSVQNYINKHYDEYYNSILSSLSNSDKPIELWNDYF
jgi:hypothetical protein